MKPSVIVKQLAKRLPNNRGGTGRHVETVRRMVKRGDLPPYDFKFADGTAGWSGETVARDPRIGTFIPDIEETAAR